MTKPLYAFTSFNGTQAEVSQCARQEVAIGKLVDLKKEEKERQRRIKELEKQISKLREILESPLETEDQQTLDAELASLMRTIEGLIAENPRRTTHVRNMRNSGPSCPRWITRGGKTVMPKLLSGPSAKFTNNSKSDTNAMESSNPC